MVRAASSEPSPLTPINPPSYAFNRAPPTHTNQPSILAADRKPQRARPSRAPAAATAPPETASARLQTSLDEALAAGVRIGAFTLEKEGARKGVQELIPSSNFISISTTWE